MLRATRATPYRHRRSGGDSPDVVPAGSGTFMLLMAPGRDGTGLGLGMMDIIIYLLFIIYCRREYYLCIYLFIYLYLFSTTGNFL